jgi:EAL domain-containing protein (putative c-di-GMP-specific phosphodiesterase class I)
MQARVTWSTRIREALEHDRFVLHGQPILDLQTGRPGLYELLLRMRGEDGQLFRPRSFLYVAERFGLMGLIDRWVVTNAISLLSAPALRDGTQKVSINISAGSLSDEDLPRFIQWELTQRGVDPRRLVLEVTETAAITSMGQAASFIEPLADLGVGFALDDFGTGFGSFYYLKHLPFGYLKIDGEFIHGLADCPTDQLVVKALVQTAKGLGTKTVAEFVGGERTVSLLRELGVDYAQGYHLGRPAPLDELLDLAS